MLDVDDVREVTRTLGAEGMPEHEIRAVLASRDPRFVRRLIDLHAERLAEQLAERRRELRRVEGALIHGLSGECPRRLDPPPMLADRSGAA